MSRDPGLAASFPGPTGARALLLESLRSGPYALLLSLGLVAPVFADGGHDHHAVPTLTKQPTTTVTMEENTVTLTFGPIDRPAAPRQQLATMRDVPAIEHPAWQSASSLASFQQWFKHRKDFLDNHAIALSRRVNAVGLVERGRSCDAIEKKRNECQAILRR